MSTEQAAYALVAYSRHVNGLTPLYDMSDATPQLRARQAYPSASG
jgi:hypothetical protein